MARYLKLTVLAAAFAMLALSAHTGTPSGGSFTIVKSTIDGGGGTSSGGSFTLSGTIGQPDAGVMSGGSYTLVGGFWGGTGAVDFDAQTSYYIY